MKGTVNELDMVHEYWPEVKQQEAKATAMALRSIDHLHKVRLGWGADGVHGECRAGGKPEGKQLGSTEHGEFKTVYHGTTVAAMLKMRSEGFPDSLNKTTMARLWWQGTSLDDMVEGGVYMAPLKECASRYPMRMGEYRGEKLTEESWGPVRVLVVCKANQGRCRWKRKQGSNVQEFYNT